MIRPTEDQHQELPPTSSEVYELQDLELQDLCFTKGREFFVSNSSLNSSATGDAIAQEDNYDDQSATYTGFESTSDTVGPLSCKIALLRKQSAGIDEQLKAGTLKMSERRRLLDQKVQIEETLGLLGHSAIKEVVRKRDSMDMSFKPKPVPEVEAAPIFSDQVQQKQQQESEPEDTQDKHLPHLFEPLRLSGRGVQREYSIDDIGALQSTRGMKERAGRGRSTRNLNASDGGAGNNNKSSGTFHASDYLFMSDDNFTSPSLRFLAITSKQSLRDLTLCNIDVEDDSEDDDNGSKPSDDEGTTNSQKKLPKGIITTYDEYKMATNVSDDALSRRRPKIRANTATANKSSSCRTDEPKELPSTDALDALAAIIRRKARSAVAKNVSPVSATSSRISHSSLTSLSFENNTTSTTTPAAPARHGRRSSMTGLMGSFLNTLNAEAETAATTCSATSFNRRSSTDRSGRSGATRTVVGTKAELRSKGRMYSM